MKNGYYLPLFLLLAIDLLLVILHLSYFGSAYKNAQLFYLEGDNSIAEHYQNFKWLGMVILAIVAGLKIDKSYLSWSYVFIFLFLEDVLRVHGHITSLIADTLFEGANQRRWKIIEIIVAAALGVASAVPAIRQYRTGAVPFRKNTTVMLILIIALAFFGIVVDQFHRLSMVAWDWRHSFVAGLVEDGGEMISASLILGYLFSIFKTKQREPQKDL